MNCSFPFYSTFLFDFHSIFFVNIEEDDQAINSLVVLEIS